MENRKEIIRIRSFAKINMGLEIVGRRSDGFHDLKTIFQTISLYDILEFSENKSGNIQLSGNLKSVSWDKSNTIYKMADIIYRNFNIKKGISIKVKKKIPPGAGLGGGSSNAAVTLLFLNNYFKLNIPFSNMIALSKSIGADIPFFLIGGTALGEGIGDLLTPLDVFGEKKIAIIFSPKEVSTKLVFSKVNLTKNELKSKIDIFLSSGDISVLENQLELSAFGIFPELGSVKTMIEDMGLNYVSMSGSGSAFFCFPNGQQIKALRTKFPSLFIGETLNRKNYFNRIGASPSGKASVFGADTRRFESSRPRE